MHPLLVFPALSSALIPTCSIGWFHRFFAIEIDACLFASLSPRALSPIQLSPSPFVVPAKSFLSIFLFDAPFSGYVPDFRCHCRFSSPCASTRQYLCASAYQSFPSFPVLLYPICHPTPTTLSSIRVLQPCLCVTFILVYKFLITFSFISVQRSIFYRVLYFWLFARL